MRNLLLVSALAIPLSACASGSISLDPADAHMAVGIAAGAYNLFCGSIGSSDFCTKQDQKLAKKAAKGANGAIDLLPPPQQ